MKADEAISHRMRFYTDPLSDVDCEAQRARLDIDPIPGVRAQEIMERLYQTPRAVIDRIEALRGPQ